MKMNIHHILVSGRLYLELEPLLRGRTDKQLRFIQESEVNAADYEWADAFVGFRPAAQFRPDGLKWIHALGAGVDAFLRHPAWNPNVLLTRTIGAFGQQISEYCLSCILADAQHRDTFGRQQQMKSWVPVPPRPLRGQKAVILGTGTIGQEVARSLGFFDMEVTGVSRSGGRKAHFARNVTMEASGEYLETADWVINTLPLTKETESVVNEAFFARMKQCGFIHVGRGASVCSKALLNAIDQGQVRLAVLDVFEEEPLPVHSPLWSHAGIRITPHISAVTGPEEAARDFLKVLEGVEQGQPPAEHRVNLQLGY